MSVACLPRGIFLWYIMSVTHFKGGVTSQLTITIWYICTWQLLKAKQWFIFVDVVSVALPLGQFVLSPKHCASAHHQTEGDPSSGIQSVHESRKSHSHLGASTGNSVCFASLQASGTGLLWNIWLHHAHTNALPGEKVVRVKLHCFSCDWVFLFLCKND